MSENLISSDYHDYKFVFLISASFYYADLNLIKKMFYFNSIPSIKIIQLLKYKNTIFYKCSFFKIRLRTRLHL